VEVLSCGLDRDGGGWRRRLGPYCHPDPAFNSRMTSTARNVPPEDHILIIPPELDDGPKPRPRFFQGRREGPFSGSLFSSSTDHPPFSQGSRWPDTPSIQGTFRGRIIDGRRLRRAAESQGPGKRGPFQCSTFLRPVPAARDLGRPMDPDIRGGGADESRVALVPR